MPNQLTDEVIEYQLMKAEEGTDFDEHMQELALAWGYKMCEDEESPHYGEIMLPDGRYVTLVLQVVWSEEPPDDA